MANKPRTVFVTGASRGIGRAIALAFGRLGDRVAINCQKNTDMLTDTARQIREAGGSALEVPCDISDYKSVEKTVDYIERTYGGIDILINNAGVSKLGIFNLAEPEDWRRLIDVNICGTINASRLVLPGMLSRHSGCIINISSIWGITGASCEVIYSMTKGAVNAFTKALAKETAPNGIRVNAIACGVIDTEMNGFLSQDELKGLVSQIPMGRLGRPEEAAELALFLASDRSAYLTGQVIVLDGGMI